MIREGGGGGGGWDIACVCASGEELWRVKRGRKRMRDERG